MRKSSKGSKVKAEQPPGEAPGVDDVKVKAVNEMMERIKHGVVLRPVKSQESKVRTGRTDQYFIFRSFLNEITWPSGQELLIQMLLCQR